MNHKIQSLSGYIHEYQKSIHQPEKFWSRIAESFYWKKPWDKVLSWNFEGPEVKWFENGKLNITENIKNKIYYRYSDIHYHFYINIKTKIEDILPIIKEISQTKKYYTNIMKTIENIQKYYKILYK